MSKSNRTRLGPLKWDLSYRLFQLIEQNPSISAEDLQIEGAAIGIEISLRSAFRFLERFRAANGNVFKTAPTHLQIVSRILLDTPLGIKLSAIEIKEKASEQSACLHLSTIYRILQRLVSTGAIVQSDNGTAHTYQWKRQSANHGHIVCVICGRNVEFHKEYLEGLAESICCSFDVQYTKSEFNLYGLCQQCRD